MCSAGARRLEGEVRGGRGDVVPTTGRTTSLGPVSKHTNGWLKTPASLCWRPKVHTEVSAGPGWRGGDALAHILTSWGGRKPGRPLAHVASPHLCLHLPRLLCVFLGLVSQGQSHMGPRALPTQHGCVLTNDLISTPTSS